MHFLLGQETCDPEDRFDYSRHCRREAAITTNKDVSFQRSNLRGRFAAEFGFFNSSDDGVPGRIVRGGERPKSQQVDRGRAERKSGQDFAEDREPAVAHAGAPRRPSPRRRWLRGARGAVAGGACHGIEMVRSLPKLNWMRLRVRMAFEAVCESDVTSKGMAMVASHSTVTERAFLASLPNDCA